MLHKRSLSQFIILFLLGLVSIGAYGAASAAQLTLTWLDNSDNESGFSIERRVGGTGSYQLVANVGANVTSYTDSNLSVNITYCYRVGAFNSAGTSAYSNENCATTPAATFTVTVSRAGTGTGTIISSPAGINCGGTCSANFTSGTAVTLAATPASGSVFAGWSGTGCSSGSVTVNSNVSCTAAFNLASAYTLNTSVVNQITSTGSSSGRIVSSPAGIDCGTDCTEIYTSGSTVTLTPIAAANSKFSGWTGDSECSNGSLTMNSNKKCTANFSINSLTLSVAKNGNGTVTSEPSGISCGSSCSYNFGAGTSVTLQAIPDAGYTFSGWTGACTGTSNCVITLSAATTVTANFFNSSTDKIGVYRPSTGEWFLDRNGNGGWDGCDIDVCAQPFAGTDGVPVVGDWNGSGDTKMGLFVPASTQWLLDVNGNGAWDGCGTDTCVTSFGRSTDRPAVGQWTTAPYDRIAVFRPTEEKWHLDLNGNGVLDGCTIDKCPGWGIYQRGDVPVTGDWTGRGTTQLGLYRPATGQWFLDRNANRSWDGCRKDICVSNFGSQEDIPVSGNWNGSGVNNIGVFRPGTGEWFLDLNGNRKWDGPNLDLYIPGYGQPGDVPVVGRW